jgi:heterodisulfide reductase subunit B
LELTGAILQAAQGADAVATVCPMCQMNLEGYQKRLSRSRGASLEMTILYLPQLLGLALGVEQELLKMGLNLSVTGRFQAILNHSRPQEDASAV